MTEFQRQLLTAVAVGLVIVAVAGALVVAWSRAREEDRQFRDLAEPLLGLALMLQVPVSYSEAANERLGGMTNRIWRKGVIQRAIHLLAKRHEEGELASDLTCEDDFVRVEVLDLPARDGAATGDLVFLAQETTADQHKGLVVSGTPAPEWREFRVDSVTIEPERPGRDATAHQPLTIRFLQRRLARRRGGRRG